MMTSSLAAGRIAAAAAHTSAALAVHAPQLLPGFAAALPDAASTVGRRLLGALVRERLVPVVPGGREHAFGRVEYATAGADDPADLLPGGLPGAPGLAREVRDAVINLAIAVARQPVAAGTGVLPPAVSPPVPRSRPGQSLGAAGRGVSSAEWPGPTGSGQDDELTAGRGAVSGWGAAEGRDAGRDADLGAGLDADEAAIAAERIAVAGHNLHPCGRTRLGWDTSDVLAHDLEAGHTRVGFLAVRDDAHLGDDVGAALLSAYPWLPDPAPGFRLQPVHAWQRDAVLRHRYRDLIDDGAVRILDAELDAVPTAALRTLLLPLGADGRRRYVKVSLDIQVTSTRRSISVASTRNGPAVSELLHRLVAGDPGADRLILLAETAGAAVPAGSGRDMSAILRDGLTGRLHPGEYAVAGGGLPFLAAELVTRFAATTGRPDDAGAAAAFLDAYARLLLPPLLRLTLHGVALEAHLQNCLPTFVGGVPHRLAVRDFAGLRLHPERLAAAGHEVALWPGSVVGTGDAGVLRAKLGYTAFQAHLGELVIRLGLSHGLDEPAAWRLIRAVVDETYDDILSGVRTGAAGSGGSAPGGATSGSGITHRPDTTGTPPGSGGRGGSPGAAGRLAEAAREDHAAFTAAEVPHKALVRMRLSGGGDEYLPVRNPLHARA